MTRKSQILKGMLFGAVSMVTGALLIQKTTKTPTLRTIPSFFSGQAPYLTYSVIVVVWVNVLSQLHWHLIILCRCN